MANPLLALTIGSSIANAFSAISQGRKQARRQEVIAQEKELQAREVARRTESELGILRDQLSEVRGDQTSNFAANLIDVGSGASVQAGMKAFENFGRVVLNKNLESSFRQRQLNLAAKFDRQLGQDLKRASVLNAFNSLYKGASSAARFSGGGGANPSDLNMFSEYIQVPASNFDFSGNV